MSAGATKQGVCAPPEARTWARRAIEAEALRRINGRRLRVAVRGGAGAAVEVSLSEGVRLLAETLPAPDSLDAALTLEGAAGARIDLSRLSGADAAERGEP